MCINSVWNLLPLHFWVAVRLVYRCRSIEVKTRPEFSLDTWLLRLKWQLASIYDQNARPFSFSKRREYFHCLSVPWDSSGGWEQHISERKYYTTCFQGQKSYYSLCSMAPLDCHQVKIIQVYALVQLWCLQLYYLPSRILKSGHFFSASLKSPSSALKTYTSRTCIYSLSKMKPNSSRFYDTWQNQSSNSCQWYFRSLKCLN